MPELCDECLEGGEVLTPASPQFLIQEEEGRGDNPHYEEGRVFISGGDSQRSAFHENHWSTPQRERALVLSSSSQLCVCGVPVLVPV